MPTAVALMRDAFVALSTGRAEAPVRLGLHSGHGDHLFMPARLQSPDAVGIKVVSVNPGNAERDLPAIHAAILVVDPRTGRPAALMDGTWLTALRTGAVGGLAADLLARPEARVVALFGAGVQARTQLEALRCVRPVAEVRLVSRSGASARRLAAELKEDAPDLKVEAVDDAGVALAGADIVVAATPSHTPVFDGSRVAEGVHVTGVGSYTPAMREVDTALIRRARVFVDAREAALAEAGDLMGPIADGDVGPDVIVGEIGEVAAGLVPGRTGPADITFFKSVGNAVQDLAVATRVLDVARERGLGTSVRL